MTLGRDAHDAASSAIGRGDVEICFPIEGHTLGTAQAAIENVDFATLRDAVDAVESQARGNAHALNPLLGLAAWSYAMNRAVMAARNEQVPLRAEGKARRID